MIKTLNEVLSEVLIDVVSVCVCENCRYFHIQDDGYTIDTQCKNPDVLVLAPWASFGCNQWEGIKENA